MPIEYMPAETYSRGEHANTLQQLVQGGTGEIETIPVAELKARLGVDELIRIPDQDYPGPELLGQTVLHINLPITYSRQGLMTALPRIVERGCFIPGVVDRPPTLSYKMIWKASVPDYVHHVTYKTLPSDMFAYPIIGGARNVVKLQELVANRYGPSYRLDSDEEINRQKILKQGLSLTWLTLEKLVSLDANTTS